jgi:hypothetical protein
MQLAIDDLHDHLITIGKSKLTADVSRELQPSATNEAPFVHVHCTILWDATG